MARPKNQRERLARRVEAQEGASEASLNAQVEAINGPGGMISETLTEPDPLTPEDIAAMDREDLIELAVAHGFEDSRADLEAIDLEELREGMRRVIFVDLREDPEETQPANPEA